MMRPAFTLVELMVVIAIILVLMAMLLPVLGTVRRQAAVASARQAVKQVTMSLETYRSVDAAHRYPPPQSDSTLALRPPAPGSSAVLALLERQGLPTLRPDQLDSAGRLLDPWGQPLRYTLTRPTVSDPVSLQTWNYDVASAHERAWGRRWDAGANAITEGALPFPYVHSLGPQGRSDLGAGWIHDEDDKR